MNYDLNIPASPHPDRAAKEKLKLILSRYSQDNESVIALNYTVKSCNPSKLKSIMPISFDTVKERVEQMTRVTVETDTVLDTTFIAALRSNYDIVAIRTSSETVFHLACTQYDIDVISLDCTQRLPFQIKTHIVQQAIGRSIYFEISYAPGIRDNQSRVYLLQIAHQLVTHTKGVNLILSSEATSVSEIRAPFDVLYFAKSLGLPNDKARFVTEKYPQALVAKSQQKRHSSQ